MSHTGEHPHQCQRCDNTFATAGGLRVHMPTHTHQYKFNCDLCGSQFATISRWKTHDITHNDEKEHKCKQCGAAFHLPQGLRSHMAHTHNNIRSYKCQVRECAYAAKTTTALASHDKTHTGEKPFTCQHCHNTYTRKTSLKKHLKTAHKDRPQ